MNSWVLDVQENEQGEKFIEFTPEMLEVSGFKEGDILQWTDNGDGSWLLTKRETELVMVECISQFRERYVVEVPKGKAEWALDTVTMQEAKEFSQEHLGETIVSHRIISKDEALEICDVDNHYCKVWNEDQKLNTFVTWMKDYE